jgi:hypothetical protein
MAITTRKIVQAGTAPAFAAPLASDTVEVGTTLIVKNGSGAGITVTLVTPGNLPTGDAYPDKAYTVGAGAEAWIPVTGAYRQPDSNNAAVTFSSVTSVTATAIAPFAH